MDFPARTHELLTHHVQGYCHGGESTCQARVMTLSNISALKDHMKCEADIVSGHLSRFEASSLRELFYSQIIRNNLSHCLHIHVQSSAISLTPSLRSEGNNVRLVSTFASVLCVSGCPLHRSSCISSRPSLNRLCQSKILNFFTAYSP
jgi:hypothetical protein